MDHWDKQAAWTAITMLCLKGDNLRIAHYWLSLWNNDRPPRRSSFDVVRVRDLVKAIAIFDVRPGEGVFCRLAGTAYTFRFGFDITKKNWVDLTPKEKRPLRIERNTTIVSGAISSGQRRDPDRMGQDQWFSDVSLPFSGENEDGSRSYLHHSDWRPRGEEHLLDRPRRHHPTTADRFVAYSIV
jgi:hypothetical protein